MICTLNLSENFAEKLVDHILNQGLTPFQMAQMQIILPTKRAVKTVKDVFLQRSEDKPLLLPKLTALYDIDVLQEDIPQSISHIERTILLTRLCQKKPNVDSLDQALTIAISLASLLDEFYQHEASFDDLESLVPDLELAAHWNETIVFLDIIRSVWPALLKEKGVIDEQDRKIRLINAFVRQIQKNGVNHPIVMAGFDGAIPAVAKLIKELDKHDNTLILLHGLNNELTDEDLSYIDENHYQYSFKKLLKSLEKFPHQIENLSQNFSAREELVTEAFRPAEQVDEWRTLNLDDDVLENVTRIDCETIDEEALTIALILREVLEIPSQTAALVTNDRMLARRVILQMKRWNVELDDSAGTPLHHTPVGVYLSLIASLGQEPNEKSSLLALLKHPLSSDGLQPTEFRKLVKKKEKEARQNQKPFEIGLNTHMDTFLSFFKENTPISFAVMLDEHLKIAESLATSFDRSGQERLWQTDVGQEAFKLLLEIKKHAETLGDIFPKDYPALMELFLSGMSVRSRYGMHQRLDILGPIEARLIHPDVCVIAGLNEGSFPMISDMGPWLSRSMRKGLKLPAVENKVAVQAMDFAHCFLSPKVYLTRSVKSGGSQTIPSRFLSRIDAVLNASSITWEIKEPAFARLIDKTEKTEQAVRPAPTPPVHVRPTQLSVTNIELLMKNPYAVYAKYILKLFPLPDIDDVQENQVYGSCLHKALELFLTNDPFNINADLLKEKILTLLKENNFSDSKIALYEEKISKIVDFVVQEQLTRKEITSRVFLEQKGEISFKLNDDSVFTLTSKADRIDDLKTNTYEIIDYKTGTVPTGTEIETGLSPQMTLEAVILREKGFEHLKRQKDIKLSYWRLNGKRSGGEIVSIPSKTSKKDVDTLIDEAFLGVQTILNRFRDENTPYIASPRPDKVKYNDYALLSREKEWLTDDETGDEN